MLSGAYVGVLSGAYAFLFVANKVFLNVPFLQSAEAAKLRAFSQTFIEVGRTVRSCLVSPTRIRLGGSSLPAELDADVVQRPILGSFRPPPVALE